MEGACDSCDSIYFLTTSSYYNNEDAALDFLKHHSVISSSVKCPRCDALCNFSKDRNRVRVGLPKIWGGGSGGLPSETLLKK